MKLNVPIVIMKMNVWIAFLLLSSLIVDSVGIPSDDGPSDDGPSGDEPSNDGPYATDRPSVRVQKQVLELLNQPTS